MMEVGEKISGKRRVSSEEMPVIGGHRGTLYKTSVFGAHRGTLHKTSVFGAYRGGTTRKDKDGREMMNEIMEDIF